MVHKCENGCLHVLSPTLPYCQEKILVDFLDVVFRDGSTAEYTFIPGPWGYSSSHWKIEVSSPFSTPGGPAVFVHVIPVIPVHDSPNAGDPTCS